VVIPVDDPLADDPLPDSDAASGSSVASVMEKADVPVLSGMLQGAGRLTLSAVLLRSLPSRSRFSEEEE